MKKFSYWTENLFSPIDDIPVKPEPAVLRLATGSCNPYSFQSAPISGDLEATGAFGTASAFSGTEPILTSTGNNV